jgi:putative oxidoreductase
MFYGLAKYSPQLLAVLRIVTALLFFEHGTQKLLGFPPMPAGMEAPAGMNPMMLFAGILELVGGLLIAVGFLTRPTAFILSGEMAVAYFIGHAPMGFFPATNMGDAAILYCFIFLYLVAAGPGAWAVDNAAQRNPA